MKTVKGNLITMGLNGEFDVIIHGANCFCTMNSGIAKEIKARIPGAYAADCQTKVGDIDKLGMITEYEESVSGLIVINAYTQYNYGTDSVHVEYTAVRSALSVIFNRYRNKRIGIPKIGCGLAGGSWDLMKWVIQSQEAYFGVDLTYVEFDGK